MMNFPNPSRQLPARNATLIEETERENWQLAAGRCF
jgi:hypothetical protein